MSQLLSSPTAQRLGMTLLHLLWQGAAVAVIVAFVAALLRPGRARYAGYLAGLAAITACPIVTWFFVHIPRPSPEPATQERATLCATAVPKAAPSHMAETPPIVAPAAPIPASLAADARHSPQPESWTGGAVVMLRATSTYFVGGWAIGVLLLSLRLIIGAAVLRRWRRTALAPPVEIAQRASALRRRLGLPATVGVLASARIRHAVAIGCWRPMVLLPLSLLSELPVDMLEAVIAHELVHIRRLDLWANLFQRIIETLLFYHPAVWWLSHRVRGERELCCDEAAVAATGQRLEYAATLERIAARSLGMAAPALSAEIGGTNRALLNRIRHVLGMSSTRRMWGWPAGMAGMLTILAGVYAMTMRPAARAAQPAARTEAANPRPVEQKAAANRPVTLHGAAALGDIDAITRFIERGDDVNRKTLLRRETPLHLAAKNGHADAVRCLLEHGASVNARDEGGATPLHRATFAGHLRAMEVLRAGGADVSEKGTGCGPPLQWAAQAGRIDAARLLLKHHAELDQKGTDEQTPLMVAVSAGQTEMVKFLLAEGAQVNARAAYGLTPLHAAAYADRAQIARILMEHGADPNLECNGRTVFQIAHSEELRRVLRDEKPAQPPTTRPAAAQLVPLDQNDRVQRAIYQRILLQYQQQLEEAHRAGREALPTSRPADPRGAELQLAAYQARVNQAKIDIARADALYEPKLRELEAQLALAAIRLQQGRRNASAAGEHVAAPERPTTPSIEARLLEEKLRMLLQKQVDLQLQLQAAGREFTSTHPKMVQLGLQLKTVAAEVDSARAELRKEQARQNEQHGLYYISGVPGAGAYRLPGQPVTILRALIAAAFDPQSGGEKYVTLIRAGADGARETLQTIRAGDLLEKREKDLEIRVNDVLIVSDRPPVTATTRPSHPGR